MTEQIELTTRESDALATSIQPVVVSFIGQPLQGAEMTSAVMAVCRSHGLIAEVTITEPEARNDEGLVVLWGPCLNISIVGRCPGAYSHPPEWFGCT